MATVDAGHQGSMSELMRALSAAKQRAKSRSGNVVILHEGDQDRTVRLPALAAAGLQISA